MKENLEMKTKAWRIMKVRNFEEIDQKKNMPDKNTFQMKRIRHLLISTSFTHEN